MGLEHQINIIIVSRHLLNIDACITRFLQDSGLIVSNGLHQLIIETNTPFEGYMF